MKRINTEYLGDYNFILIVWLGKVAFEQRRGRSGGVNPVDFLESF